MWSALYTNRETVLNDRHYSCFVIPLWYNYTECLLAAKHVALFPGLQYAKTKVWKVSPFAVMIGRHAEGGAWRRLFLVQSCSSIGGWNVWKAASIQLVVWYTQSWLMQSLWIITVGHDHLCVYRLSAWHHCLPGLSSSFFHTASDHKMKLGKAWEQRLLYKYVCLQLWSSR